MKDFNYKDDSITLIDEKELIIQQIDLLFDTNYGDVFGEIDFGSDFNAFLWDMNISNKDITDYTKGIITKYINIFDWDLDVDTTILEGTQNDIILIKIILTKDFDKIEKTYKVE